MNKALQWGPLAICASIILAMLVYGPIAQLDHYHAFADSRAWLGVANAADVLSNIGFVIAGLFGMVSLACSSARKHAAWPGFMLFAVALTLTAFGSAYYHLLPDNARLVWDRLPIALACAGLLAGAWAQAHPREASLKSWWLTLGLAIFAVFSVWYWQATDAAGAGDLRPYLLLQILPLLLVPIWQAQAGVTRNHRLAFGAAILLYVLAKVAEVSDHAILHAFDVISGHTIKHVLASLAGGVIVLSVVQQLGVQSHAPRYPQGEATLRPI